MKICLRSAKFAEFLSIFRILRILFSKKSRENLFTILPTCQFHEFYFQKNNSDFYDFCPKKNRDLFTFLPTCKFHEFYFQKNISEFYEFWKCFFSILARKFKYLKKFLIFKYLNFGGKIQIRRDFHFRLLKRSLRSHFLRKKCMKNVCLLSFVLEL